MIRDTAEYRGVRVLSGKNGTSKVGKIKRAVFHPLTYDLVGYLVKRPDFLFIKARADRFLALDSLRIVEGKVVGYADRDAWDQAACRRLGLDFDNCIILEDMPIIAQGATEPLGAVVSVLFNEKTGALDSIKVSDSAAAKALLGTQDIPRALLIGYRDGAVWVAPDAEAIALSGGLAAKAGAGVAVAGNKVSEATAKAGAKVEQVTTDAAIKIGRGVKRTVRRGGSSVRARQAATSDTVAAAIDGGAQAVGRQLGASKGMFKAFRDEYRQAAGGGPDKGPGKGSGSGSGKNAGGSSGKSSGKSSRSVSSSGSGKGSARKAINTTNRKK